ncbi:CinA family protein [Variovorax sp. J2P1-59]|uniref:CinA family protein n=1 Tax=Variovorax flavidus TaxID=3053501 RepID=UPI00257740D7|nr:CinA family protein [Variovorax sp. J2P1-59]MDM0077683.1 CinA family protein [Variovorax sp. J2P1-59]
MTSSNDSGLPSLAVLAERVGAALKERKETIAVVESSAGGLVSAALLAVPGASAFFLGGAVVYSRRAGKALLGLTAVDVAGMRAETEPYAVMVAGKIRDSHRASWGISESGAAGPSGSPYGDAPGHVCIAVVGAATLGRTIETGNGDRAVNMDLFARYLLQLFEEALLARSN